MKISRFTFNPYQEQCYLLSHGGKCVIIDPGCLGAGEEGTLTAAIESGALVPKAILLTHAHFDHIYGVGALVRRYGIPVYMGQGEDETLRSAPLLARVTGMPAPDTSWESVTVQEGERLNFGEGLVLEVIATPGHTPGGVCYHCPEQKLLFCGDTLFAGSIGRTDLPGGDYDKEIVSIMEKLIWLDGATELFPGHGPGSTIARERTRNPFLEPFNEREELDL